MQSHQESSQIVNIIPDKLETFQLEFDDITEVSKKDINRWGSKVLHSKTRVHDKHSKSRSPPAMDSKNQKWGYDKGINPSYH